MSLSPWPFRRVILWLGLSITFISGIILIWINLVKPPDGLGTGLISAALFFVGLGVLVYAGILYLLN